MKTQITIRGRRYTVRSDDDQIDLPAIARYVDRRMEEVAHRMASFDEYTVAMLAAMNIAEDFERFRQRVDQELASVDRELASASVLIEAALPSTGDDEPPEEGG